jgi:hypothetical protein
MARTGHKTFSQLIQLLYPTRFRAAGSNGSGPGFLRPIKALSQLTASRPVQSRTG